MVGLSRRRDGPIARKAGFPCDAAFWATLGAVMAGVGTAIGGADGDMPFGGGWGVPNMIVKLKQLLLVRCETRCF